MPYLTETAPHDEPGSWGRCSIGWPEITGDDALLMYEFAVMTKLIPYGSYVLMSEKGKYGAKESCLRVHADQITALKTLYRLWKALIDVVEDDMLNGYSDNIKPKGLL